MNKQQRRMGGLAVAAASGAGFVSTAALAGGYGGPVVTPDPLAFGTVAVGATSATQMLSVDLAGQSKGGALDIVSIAFPPGFARNGGTCPNTGLTTSDPCTIGVVFQPTSNGAQAGTVDITASSFGGPAGTTSVGVSGFGGVVSVPTMGLAGSLLLLVALAVVAARQLSTR